MQGTKAQDLKEIRAEVWDLTDLELKFWQARELYHTDSLRDSPDADAFYRYIFHEAVEDKINRFNLKRLPQCPSCYRCGKHPGHETEGCPAFISYESFSALIGKEVDKVTMSRAFTRDMAREQVPEITKLTLPSPSATIPILYGLLRGEVLNKDEAIALAQKTSDGQLGNLTEKQRQLGHTGPVNTLQIISGYLRAGVTRGAQVGREKLPDKVRTKLIHTPNYGPAEAEWELETVKMPEKPKSQVKQLKEYINSALRIDDYLQTLREGGKTEGLDLVDFLAVLRLLAKHFNEFADFIEGGAK